MSSLTNMTVAIACGLLVLLAPVNRAVAGAASSASFSIERMTLSAGAEASSSASFVLTPTINQELVVGTSASPGFVIQSGFWSFLGSGLVPVVLSVEPGVAPDEVNLSWSGNNAPYEVFQATDCAAVFGMPLTTTGDNELAGVGTTPAGLTCFNVLATAPGPVPPRP